MEELRLITVVTTALIDSINPCAIGVLVLLIGALIEFADDRKRMVLIGSLYILIIYITYFAAGIGLLFFIQKMQLANTLGVIVGFLVMFLGFIEIKDFFWYGKGFSLQIPAFGSNKIKKMVRTATGPSVIVLGFLVAAVELPCTGGPYLAITALLAQDSLDLLAISYLLLYNFIFVLPLFVILGLAYWGTTAADVEHWKGKYKKWMRLAGGLIMVALGVLLILFANGVIGL